MSPSASEFGKAVDNGDNVAANTANLKLVNQADNGPSYPFYLPYYDSDEKFPPTEIFEFSDVGLLADKAKPTLLNGNTQVKHLSPYLGTDVSGVQISQLSSEGLNELALYAAERKVLVFRDQDFKDLTPDRQIEIGFPEFHVVYRDISHNRLGRYPPIHERNNLTSWHSDVTYEKQTPATTFFFILDQPEVGGDTLFVSQVEAYNRLSDEFKKRLIGLRAVHSAVPQADFSRNSGGPVRREPVQTEHPVVRVHPVTGEKALFVNQGFTQRIVGFKKEESDLLLNFLFDHIATGSDFRIRASYQPGTVVIWDNRVTVHSATPDYDPRESRRHAVRLTPQAEVPIAAGD